MKDCKEVEVFRVLTFDPNLTYAFALKTRTQGKWPNEKHYTTHPLDVVGKYIGSKRWGSGDGSGGSEIFEHNGVVREITLDYNGLTCFSPVSI
jgi:hypothetical protein